MSLTNAVLIAAPTSYTVNGGSNLTFASLGPVQNGKVQLYVYADTDLRTRRTIDVSVKAPAVSVVAPNGYTQARASVLIKCPKLLANGKITINTARVELGYDVESTATDVQQLLDLSAQVCFDADFTDSFKKLSLA